MAKARGERPRQGSALRAIIRRRQSRALTADLAGAARLCYNPSITRQWGEGAMPSIVRNIFASAAALIALLLAVPEPAFTQSPDYPNRKITFIVGFAPGGGIDVL